jgi:hypothetical protein
MLLTSQQRQPRIPTVSQTNERPHAQNAPAVPPRPIEEVGDDHGRPLTTNAAAAAWYRAAQGSVVRGDGPDPALRRALQADPTFAVAACDLLALTDDPPPAEPARPTTSWERHHCEIVAEAHRDVGRASGILREHLADVGCDPLAVHIVCAALLSTCGNGGRSADVADLLASTAECHPLTAAE